MQKILVHHSVITTSRYTHLTEQRKRACPFPPHPNLPPQAGEGAIESLREFYDYESAEAYINTLMGQIKVGWNRVV